jgi:prevent-host-death family protein
LKLVGVREVQEHLSELLQKSQTEKIVVLRHGRPVAVLSGIEGRDLEEILFEQDPRFAELIASRRRGSPRLVPLEEAAAHAAQGLRLAARSPRYRARAGTGAGKRRTTGKPR